MPDNTSPTRRRRAPRLQDTEAMAVTLPTSRSLPGTADAADAEAPVASPCVLVCLYDKDLDACRGCFRSLDEIAHWSIYTAQEQRDVLERVAARRSRSGAQPAG
jgi:predicted Fe-S protein YdhL (DUF1289 family)